VPKPWWKERQRLTTHCPRCAKRYVRGQPGWSTCLGCEVNPKWTTVTEAEFIAKAKKVFPDSEELSRRAMRAGAGEAIKQLLEDERPDLTFQISFPDDGAYGDIETVGDDPDSVDGRSASLPDEHPCKRAA
jgi:hypothetical protein